MAQTNSRSSSGSDNHPSRRDFLRRAGFTAGGFLTLNAPSLLGKWVDHAVAAARPSVAGKFALELDGQAAGFVYGFEGGAAVGEVATIAMGQKQIPNKQLTNLRYEPITVEFGPGMSKPWYEWITNMLNMSFQPRNGAVLSLDFNYLEQSRLNFTNALITEITFPALDAASKDVVSMTVKLAPENTRQQAGSKAVVKGATSTAKTTKAWLPATFRLFIQGLEQATKRVHKIEALTIKVITQSDQVGQMRDYQKGPVAVDIPNLIITIPEIDAGPFYQWHEDFVIKGQNGPDKERPGVLEWLDPTLKTVLGSLQFFNLGIFKIAPEKVETAAETIRRVKVEMYCERITAAFPGFA